MPSAVNRAVRAPRRPTRPSSIWAHVSCSLCVQLPTGIDIRNGLQYQCIGCGACADVCDTVMDKVGYARGLVKYSTENAMKNHWTAKQTMRHVLRPRVLVYTSILLGIIVAIFVSLGMRTPFKVNVVRDRGVMARVVEAGKTENVYRLQVHERHRKRPTLQDFCGWIAYLGHHLRGHGAGRVDQGGHDSGACPGRFWRGEPGFA